MLPDAELRSELLLLSLLAISVSFTATARDAEPQRAVAMNVPGTYQPIVYVTLVGASVCSDGLKPPTSSYAKP